VKSPLEGFARGVRPEAPFARVLVADAEHEPAARVFVVAGGMRAALITYLMSLSMSVKLSCATKPSIGSR
jgi:hypothetical protein